MKLHHLRTMRTGNLDCFVGALGIDHIDFAEIAQRPKAAWQVLGLIARRDNYSDRNDGSTFREFDCVDLSQVFHRAELH